jgi:hypothetical protein
MDAFLVDGGPFVTVDFEGESLFVVGSVDHDRSAGFDHLGDALPEEGEDAGADLPTKTPSVAIG